ncbi:MAG TPA: tRNA (adenosine(37)-N6)-threonylcarbamoyltransferase complex ATPase subunit type 1 TsaE [Acidimicrobiales bacterium]|nr:tRNA (adenosine(37)-N6)-threonylcarbamoyltransferase complex ATPase subunit type 1 TsaE [Acidimicrobiales bacterium]
MVIAAATSSVEATRDLAAAVAGLVHAADVILLTGDLGAGKTAFAQGFARALGVDEQVTSPTFTLARSYEGRLRLHHLDVYRLDHLQEAVDLGLPEIVDDGGVTLIEWGDVVIPALPADYLEVRIAYGDGDDDRTLELVTVGSRWTARTRALTESLVPWVPGGGGGC